MLFFYLLFVFGYLLPSCVCYYYAKKMISKKEYGDDRISKEIKELDNVAVLSAFIPVVNIIWGLGLVLDDQASVKKN